MGNQRSNSAGELQALVVPSMVEPTVLTEQAFGKCSVGMNYCWMKVLLCCAKMCQHLHPRDLTVTMSNALQSLSPQLPASRLSPS